MRHAKAENQDTKKPDFERALIDKGVRHAQKIAKLVETFRFPPEAIYTSSAIRALETAKIFASTLKLENNFYPNDFFYSAPKEGYLQKIQNFPDELDNILIVGHNPVLEDLLPLLTARAPFHTKMPTCALAAVHFHVSLWSEIRPATGILRLLIFPKLFAD
ncbi:MAG: hypothetical protein LDLANPLL_01228 [Turneriella sp.]|nr:hypothetical protein [Turneriella sp.]